jgi:hypothetical protein
MRYYIPAKTKNRFCGIEFYGQSSYIIHNEIVGQSINGYDSVLMYFKFTLGGKTYNTTNNGKFLQID